MPCRLLLLTLAAAVWPAAGLAAWESDRHWSVLQPVCVPIPHNMTLCRDIGYTQLRLPNLLQHESLSELVQQSATWTPLLSLRCDPDTQLFLCSLYAPICLERSIYPCRSLCEKVKLSCGARMAEYGYPWPDIVRCDKFPRDNDMCIKPQSNRTPTEESAGQECAVCQQPANKENIMDHYCRSDVVAIAKFRRLRPDRAQCGRAKLFKPHPVSREERRALRRPTLAWRHDPACCPQVKARAGRYLVMARRQQERLVPTLVLPWKRSKLFRSLRSLMLRFDCSDARAIQEKVLPPLTPRRRKKPQKGRGRRRERGWRRRPGAARGRAKGAAARGRRRPAGRKTTAAPATG